MYVEKAYNTVHSDSSVGWGRYAWRPPWCFSRRVGYESAPGFTFSLPFIITSHSTTQLQYTNSYTYSHPNLNFLQYTIQILVPQLMWSAQAVRDLKIDPLNAIYPPCAEPEAHNSAVGWHWNTHTVINTDACVSTLRLCTSTIAQWQVVTLALATQILQRTV